MNDCKKYKELIKKRIASGLDSHEQEILNNHVKTCGECNKFLLIHQKLEQNQEEIPMPDADEFRIQRQNILRNIRVSQSSQTDTLWDRLKSLFIKVEFAYGLAGLLFLLTLYNFMDSGKKIEKAPSDLIEQIDYTAQQNSSLTDIANSPYTYGNIEIKEIDGQQIRLGFNVSTYIELTRKKDDPIVKEILAQSIINSGQIGERLNTISYAEQIIDPKLKETFIYILLNDPELAVRMKALDILTQYSNDKQIQDAFITVLKNEESVKMRLSALDYLTFNQVDAKLIARELSAATTRINRPILIRAQEYIQDINNN